jgi:hypothetical protein
MAIHSPDRVAVCSVRGRGGVPDGCTATHEPSARHTQTSLRNPATGSAVGSEVPPSPPKTTTLWPSARRVAE